MSDNPLPPVMQTEVAKVVDGLPEEKRAEVLALV
jgi:hypothetical protein